jgi:hypothetical protein
MFAYIKTFFSGIADGIALMQEYKAKKFIEKINK